MCGKCDNCNGTHKPPKAAQCNDTTFELLSFGQKKVFSLAVEYVKMGKKLQTISGRMSDGIFVEIRIVKKLPFGPKRDELKFQAEKNLELNVANADKYPEIKTWFLKNVRPLSESTIKHYHEKTA